MLDLDLLPAPLAIVRLSPASPIPEWAAVAESFLSMTRTPEELSIVTDVGAIPAALLTGPSYLAFRVRGPLSHDLVGIFAALAEPLAAAGIPVFPIATYDTDYLLVREQDAYSAASALEAEGHRISRG
jgi:hypothetical protein